MDWQRLAVVAGAVALGAGAPGLALLGSGVVLWFMLHYTRLITIMKRAQERPIGHIGSAVMLNAKLKVGMPLLQVIAVTRSLGRRLSPADAEPEQYRWTDPGDSQVTAEFHRGRLVRWWLERPPPAAGPTSTPQAEA